MQKRNRDLQLMPGILMGLAIAQAHKGQLVTVQPSTEILWFKTEMQVKPTGRVAGNVVACDA